MTVCEPERTTRGPSSSMPFPTFALIPFDGSLIHRTPGSFGSTLSRGGVDPLGSLLHGKILPFQGIRTPL